jgi:flavin-dependent dehydrogenase
MHGAPGTDPAVVTKVVKDRAGVDHLLAPRRIVLDRILLDAAARAGAEVLTGVSVTDVLRSSDGRVTGIVARDEHGQVHRLAARVVVGADGVGSRIARAVQARTIEAQPSTAATYYAYVAGLGTNGFEFHVGDQSFAGLFTTHGHEANVWVCAPARRATLRGGDRTRDFLELLDRCAPTLAARVRDAEITSPVRGAVCLPNHVREAVGTGWALVGDAGYHRDPITGHGITDAFRDAELLARHLGSALRGERAERDALAAYAAERYAALKPIFDITCQLASYPQRDEFAELQKELGRLIDDEACRLASLPALSVPAAAAA